MSTQAKVASQQGKVVIYDKTTGQAFERWPVDAREMMATGAYCTEPPGAPAAEAAVASPPTAPSAPVIDPALVHTAEVTDKQPAPTEYAPGVPLVVAKQGTQAVGTAAPTVATRTTGAKK